MISDTKEIPFIFKNMFENLTFKEFSLLKLNLNESTFVCEDCYLLITAATKSSGVNLKPVFDDKLLGKWDLRPEKTSKWRW